ncbi:uncharacterized protein LOC142353394 [Convolutriloba macropyga]|uniref:uncharacterized protein LOC142353394 n=1 Tax=Convolutriloba macropyga TaxID=536237 RepID=UPI003F525E3D
MAALCAIKIRDYEILKVIGEGSFGKALLVRNGSGEKLVLKEIKMQKMTPKEKRETKREVDLLARLKHPYIVSYVESFEEKG